MSDRPVGRPSLYDPAYCDVAETFLRDGYSVAALAGHIGVCVATVKNWMGEHPDFLASVKRGQAGAVLWWETAHRNLAMTGEGNATACVFGLKNRASDEWRDVKATEISGPGGGPVQMERINDEADAFTRQIAGMAERTDAP